jgi:quercetin dioxygenase-like cupin family protein
MTITVGKVVASGELEAYQWLGETGRFLLTNKDTGGRYTLMDITTSPSGGPPLHTHEREDEAFLVLDGEYEIRLGDDTHRAGPGGLVYGPRGVPHAFRNLAEEPGRMLVIATPGGVEEFFIGLSRIVNRAGRPDFAEIEAHAARHHIVGLEVPPARPGGPAA